MTLQEVHRRRSAVHLPQVFVEEFDVALGDSERGRTVAEDALQAEDVPAIRQEGAGEGVAQDVWRAADLQAGP